MTLAVLAAIASALAAVLAAPLVLGSYVIAKGLDQRWHTLWLWSLTGMLAASLLVGAVGTLLLLFLAT